MRVACKAFAVAGVMVLLTISAGPARAQGEIASASDLRLALGRALGEHAILSMELMRAGLEGDDPFRGAGEAVEENTVAIAGLVGELYGDEAEARFGELWREHIAYLVDYTRAVLDEDDDGEQAAIEALEQHRTELVAFVSTANPHIDAATLDSMLEDHVSQLEQVANLLAGRQGAAYDAMRAGYRHMYDLGDVLARAWATQFAERFPGAGEAFSPALDLRLTLHRLLGEHVMLAYAAVRSAASSSADLQAAADALADNSAELQQAMADIYGSEAGDEFGRLWRAHTTAYLEYARAAAGPDAAGRVDGLESMHASGEELGRFLTAANPGLEARELEALLGEHMEQLADAADAYVAQEYADAYASARAGYAHIGQLAEALAAAVASQFPDRFPDTATGGPPPSTRAALILLGAAVLLPVVVILSRSQSRA